MASWQVTCAVLLTVVSLVLAADKCKPNNKGGCEQANKIFNRCNGQCILEKGSCICRKSKLSPTSEMDPDPDSHEVIEFLGTSQGGCYSTRDGCKNEGCGGGGVCKNYGTANKNDCRCELPKASNATMTPTTTTKRPSNGK